jgi:hypothetical protein
MMSVTQKRLAIARLLIFALGGLGYFAYHRMPKMVPARLIDLRKDTSLNHYSIMFILRDAGFYGHAFISTSDYSRQDTFPKTVGYGLYSTTFEPAKIVKGETEAEVLEDFSKVNEQTPVMLTLVIWVDKPGYVSCTKLLNEAFEKSARYELFNNDCITFLEKFTSTLGLKRPSRILNPTPNFYIESLFEVN